jgi:hypothetical protein
MSEKFDPQEYRHDLAESLTKKRDFGEEGRELAKEQLDLEKGTIEYKRAEIQHKEENLIAKGRIPTPDAENIEVSKLEWGPELGKMLYDDGQAKIAELNTKLTEGEKAWRLPTKDELVARFEKTNSTPTDEKYYWSSTTRPDNKDNYMVSTRNGRIWPTGALGPLADGVVCCVR